MDTDSLSAEDFDSIRMPVGPGGIVFNHVHQKLQLFNEVSVRPCGTPRKTSLPWPCAHDTISGQDVLISTFYDFVTAKMIDDHVEFMGVDNYHTLLGNTSFAATTETPSGVWQIGDQNRRLLCFLILFPDGKFISNGGIAPAPYVQGRFQFNGIGISFEPVHAWNETKGRKDGRFIAATPVQLSIPTLAHSRLEFVAQNESGKRYIFAAYRPAGP